MRKNYFLVAAFLSFAVNGFSQQQYYDGVLILNEGNMGSNDASVSFLSPDNELTNYIDRLANNDEELGDVGQSIAFHDDKAFIVLNASNKIVVVNSSTFEYIETIDTGLVNPRYMAFSGNKAYITCWGVGSNEEDDYLAVLDLDTYTLGQPVPMTNGVEKIEEINGKLYIAHQGGYGFESKVSVYNIADATTTVINVGDVPKEMIVSGNNIYLLNGGIPDWASSLGLVQTPSSIGKIDLTTDTYQTLVTFSEDMPASHMAQQGDGFYVTSKEKIYKYSLTTNTLDTAPFITTPVTDYLGIYGMDIIEDKIYVGDANGYGNSGFVYVYSMEGNLLDTFNVGGLPNHFYPSAVSPSAGIDDPKTSLVSLYPNPVSDRLYVNSKEEFSVIIFDLFGKQILKTKTSTQGIDVSYLANGTYIVRLENNKQVQTLKLIKK